MPVADIALHYSRTAPLCRDCRHLRTSKGEARCNHPATPIDAVTGEPEATARVSRDPKGPCGPTGWLFQPRSTTSHPSTKP